MDLVEKDIRKIRIDLLKSEAFELTKNYSKQQDWKKLGIKRDFSSSRMIMDF